MLEKKKAERNEKEAQAQIVFICVNQCFIVAE